MNTTVYDVRSKIMRTLVGAGVCLVIGVTQTMFGAGAERLLTPYKVWDAKPTATGTPPFTFLNGSTVSFFVKKGDRVYISSIPTAVAVLSADDRIFMKQPTTGTWLKIYDHGMMVSSDISSSCKFDDYNIPEFYAEETDSSGGGMSVPLYVLVESGPATDRTHQQDVKSSIEPINLVSGALWQDWTDFGLAAPGMPLTFERHYNSLNDSSGSSLGSGWAHSWEWRIIKGTPQTTLTSNEEWVCETPSDSYRFMRLSNVWLSVGNENPYEMQYRDHPTNGYVIYPKSKETSVLLPVDNGSTNAGLSVNFAPEKNGANARWMGKIPGSIYFTSWLTNEQFFAQQAYSWNQALLRMAPPDGQTNRWCVFPGTIPFLRDHRTELNVHFGKVERLATSGSCGTPGQYTFPEAFAFDSSNRLYFSDYASDPQRACLQRRDNVSSNWEILATFGTGLGQVYSPVGLAIDSQDSLYSADWSQYRIQKRASDGTWTTLSSGVGYEPGYTEYPYGLGIDSSDNLYVSCQHGPSGPPRIQKRSVGGTWSIVKNYTWPQEDLYDLVVGKKYLYVMVLRNGANGFVDVIDINSYDLIKSIPVWWASTRLGFGDGYLYVPGQTTISRMSEQDLTLTCFLDCEGNDFRLGSDTWLFRPDKRGNFAMFENRNGMPMNMLYAVERRELAPWTMTFSQSGHLQEIEDLWSNRVSVTQTNMDGVVRVKTVRHSNGQFLDFQYNTSGVASSMLSRVSSNIPELWEEFFYDGNGRFAELRRHEGDEVKTNTFKYAVQGLGRLTNYVNEAGESFDYTYVTNTSVVSSNRAASVSVGPNKYYEHYVTYNPSARQSQVRYVRGATNLIYAYNYATNVANPRLSSIVGPGLTTNTSTTFVYDRFGRIDQTWQAEPGAKQTNIAVEAKNRMGLVTQAGVGMNVWPTNLWNYTYDASTGQLTEVKGPDGSRTTFDYDRAKVTRERQWWSATNAYDHCYGYTSNGLLAAVTNANGHWVRFGYDSNSFLASVMPQIGPGVTYSNDALGNVLRVVLPGASATRTTLLDRDVMGKVHAISYPDGGTESMKYDAMGNLTNIVDRGGRVTRLAWAPTRKLVSTIRDLPEGGSRTNLVSYDQQFNTVHLRDALNRPVESYVLDPQDRPVTVTNLEGQTMTVQYGLRDNVLKLTRFDGTSVSNLFDKDGLVQKTYFPGDTNNYLYTRSGLPRVVSNLAGAVTFAYDSVLWLTNAVGCGPGGGVRYTYYPGGQVSNAISRTGTRTYRYDEAERLTNLTSEAGSFGWVYNAWNGLPESTRYGSVVDAIRTYDVMSRMTSLVWKVNGQVVRRFDMTYNSTGLIERVIREDGSYRRFGYDGMDQLIADRSYAADDTMRSDTGYSYDAVGNRLGKSRDGKNVVYDYPYGSSGNRLSGWRLTTPASALSVDVAGVSSEPIGTDNRFGKLYVSNAVSVVTPAINVANFVAPAFPLAAGTQDVVAAVRDQAGNTVYVTNRIVAAAVTNASYLYNTAGCVTNIRYSGQGYVGNIGFVWDGKYQLTEVRTNNVMVEKYRYDALGRRVFVSDGSTTNWFVYDGMHVIAETGPTGNVLRSYTYGPGVDNALAMTVHTGLVDRAYYYLTDHLNTVHALVDEAGQIVEQYEYDAWGRVLSVKDGAGNLLSSSAIGNQILWQGREYSWKLHAAGGNSGFYYFRARWYDPVVGRWLSNDPIGISGGLNQYVFCVNKPVNIRDPFGLKEGAFMGWFGRLARSGGGSIITRLLDVLGQTAGYIQTGTDDLNPLDGPTTGNTPVQTPDVHEGPSSRTSGPPKKQTLHRGASFRGGPPSQRPPRVRAGGPGVALPFIFLEGFEIYLDSREENRGFIDQILYEVEESRIIRKNKCPEVA